VICPCGAVARTPGWRGGCGRGTACTSRSPRWTGLATRRSWRCWPGAGWRESGLGAPLDRDQLTQRITALEQRVVDLKLELDERDEELAAARAANRELITRINTEA